MLLISLIVRIFCKNECHNVHELQLARAWKTLCTSQNAPSKHGLTHIDQGKPNGRDKQICSLGTAKSALSKPRMQSSKMQLSLFRSVARWELGLYVKLLVCCLAAHKSWNFCVGNRCNSTNSALKLPLKTGRVSTLPESGPVSFENVERFTPPKLDFKPQHLTKAEHTTQQLVFLHLLLLLVSRTSKS